MSKRSELYRAKFGMYGAETWTLIRVSGKLLEAFEMWTWRKMLKISWTEKVTNEEVPVKLGAY